jgi:hypothetical protein
MKNKTMFTTALNARFVCIGTRRFRCNSVLPTLLAAGVALLLGPGGGFRVAAQFQGPSNEEVLSIGVFQLEVDPAFYPLMDWDGVAGHLPYPGWNHDTHILTSPVLADFSGLCNDTHETQIAAGTPAVRMQIFPSGGLTVGVSPTDQIMSYDDYLQWPDASLPGAWDFQYCPAGHREVLTEIQSFNLATWQPCYPPNDPRFPSNIPNCITMVRAGWGNLYNNRNNDNPTEANYLRKSIGMIQASANSGLSADDFSADPPVHNPPWRGAQSFFDIYVEISLPPMDNVCPQTHFPFYGAVLTNADLDVGVAAPLIVTSLDIKSNTWPPQVVYSHTAPSSSQPFAVPLKFKYDSDPAGYWTAGQTFGYISLAGHGVTGYSPCGTKDPSVYVKNFLDKVLGPVGQMAQSAIVGRIFPDALFPSFPTAYASMAGTNSAGTSNDEVMFTNGATVLHARDFNIHGFTNRIVLPGFNNSIVYTNPTSIVTFKISTDGTNFYPATATGQVQVLIVNTNPSAGSATNYYTELQALNVTGSSVYGSLRLRESPTKSSPGRHVVQSASTGYRIGGNFSALFEYSFNNGVTYKEASRPINLKQILDCAAAPTSLSATLVGPSTVKIEWAGTCYRLQRTGSLSPPISWVDLPVSSPYTFEVPTTNGFFRLVCP